MKIKIRFEPAKVFLIKEMKLDYQVNFKEKKIVNNVITNFLATRGLIRRCRNIEFEFAAYSTARN